MKLSILICSLTKRKEFLNNLINLLIPQLNDQVEVLIQNDDGTLKIGEKRTKLINMASGTYVAFIDDDDEVSKDYVAKIMDAVKSSPDCCSLTGVITWNGVNPEIFEHSLKYNAWKDNTNNEPIKYERPPNHLNAIKREIAIKYDFVPINHGEDREWSMRVLPELKTESTIEGVIYHYKYISNK